MVEQAFNPAMLKLGRERLGLRQAELALHAGVTQALVSKMENGLIGHPGDEAMEKLARVMRLPPEFFYQQDRVIGLPHFHYRERNKLAAKSLAQIEAVINIRRQHVSKLLQSYDVETLRPIPQVDLEERGIIPERVAEQLREYWMIPRGPVRNVVDVIEEAGGIVILAKFDTALLDGISFRTAGLPPLFFMNKDSPGDHFRLSLARELGHIVLHTVPDDDEKMADQARRFATAFLMPSKDVRPYLATPSLSAFAKVKAFWKVPIDALIERTAELRLITPSQHRTLAGEYKKLIRSGEPMPLEAEQPSRLKAMIKHHTDVLGYTTAELAKLLCLLPGDVEQHYSEPKTGLRLVVSN